jgi:hypothetical protein
MFFPVNRFNRPLAFLLIAAQLLLAMPAFSASVVASAASPATQSEPPCHGMSGRTSPDDPGTPSCCDSSSMQTCLAYCTLGAAMVMNSSLPTSPAARINAQPAPAAFVAAASPPPLKPPPIR